MAEKYCDAAITGSVGPSGVFSFEFPEPYENVVQSELLALQVARSEYNVTENNRYVDFTIGEKGRLSRVDITNPGGGYMGVAPPATIPTGKQRTAQRSSHIQRHMGVQLLVRGVPVPWDDLPMLRANLSGSLNTFGGIVSFTVHGASRTYDSAPELVISPPFGQDFVLGYDLHQNIPDGTGVQLCTAYATTDAQTGVTAWVPGDVFVVQLRPGLYDEDTLLTELNRALRERPELQMFSFDLVGGKVAVLVALQEGVPPTARAGLAISATAFDPKLCVTTTSWPTTVVPGATAVSASNLVLPLTKKVQDIDIVLTGMREALKGGPVAVASWLDANIASAISVVYEKDSLVFKSSSRFTLYADEGSVLNVLNAGTQSVTEEWQESSVKIAEADYRVTMQPKAPSAARSFALYIKYLTDSIRIDQAAEAAAVINPTLTAALRPGLYEIGTVVHSPFPDVSQSSVAARRESLVSRRQAGGGLIKELQDAMNLAWAEATSNASWLSKTQYDADDILSAGARVGVPTNFPCHDNRKGAYPHAITKTPKKDPITGENVQVPSSGLGAALPYDMKFLVSLEDDSVPLQKGFDDVLLRSTGQLQLNASRKTRVRISTVEELADPTVTTDNHFQLLFRSGPNAKNTAAELLGFERVDYVTPVDILHRQYVVTGKNADKDGKIVPEYFPAKAFVAPNMFRLHLGDDIVQLNIVFNGGSVGSVDFFICLDGYLRPPPSAADGSVYQTAKAKLTETGYVDYRSLLERITETPENEFGTPAVTNPERGKLADKIAVSALGHNVPSKVTKGVDFGRKVVTFPKTNIHNVRVRFESIHGSAFAGMSGPVVAVFRLFS